MRPTNLTFSTIEHIAEQALLRETKPLTREENIELFDSIDCLDINELSELYAITMIGLKGNVSDFERLIDEAKSMGFQVVDTLWRNEKLGSALKIGCELLESDNT